MGAAILMSIIVATVAVPAVAARDPNPRRGLKRALLFLTVSIVIWLLLVVVVYTRQFVPEIPPP